MKQLIPILFLFLAVPATAKYWTGGVTYLNNDSLKYGYNLEENWLFHPGDDTTWAGPGYNDNGWIRVHPELKKSDHPKLDFNGVAWLRLHILIDSDLVGKSLALAIKQMGASEIYLDGRKIATYGHITTADSTEYYNPQGIPLPIHFDSAGVHVIAVRYACYFAREASESYNQVRVGFAMSIGKAGALIDNYFSKFKASSMILLLLAGLFFALSGVHFLLWAFRRSDKSNLYFSIFCISLFGAFLLPYLSMILNDPKIGRWASYGGMVISIAGCVSLSGISNVLFAKKMLRFYILAICSILSFPLFLVNSFAGVIMLIVMITIVTFESSVLAIAAIYRKQKGALIVGIGVLFLALFLFCLIIVSFITDGVQINDATTGGAILMLLLVASILSIPVSLSIYLASNFANMNRDLNLQLAQVKLLSAKNLEQELEKQHLLETRKEELEKEVALRTDELKTQHEELKKEKSKSDELLRNILPEEIAEELKNKGSSEARYFDHVTVIFTDFVDFTKAGERMTPQQLVDELHTCFKAFDDIISRYQIEKIKTIGDAYLAVCGLPAADNNHAINTVKAAIEIKQFMQERMQRLGDKTFKIRIGIHSGAVVAGIVGVKKFAYDIWGDTVNTAARMESASEPDKINVSASTYELIKDEFECTYRGEIAAKNKGDMDMYFVEGEKI